MYRFYRLLFVSIISLSACILPVQARAEYSRHKLQPGENVSYKAHLGLFTIGTLNLKSDKTLYRSGDNVYCKVQVDGSSNSFIRMLYFNDRWVSYVDVNSMKTLKSFRSIREGKYSLDEWTSFNQHHQWAEVRTPVARSGKLSQTKIYRTPQNMRDLVAGFMLVRLIDYSKYKCGDKIHVDGFYANAGYQLNIQYAGCEYVDTDKGKIMCHRLKPRVAKNKMFKAEDAVDIWVNANCPYQIVNVKARLALGELKIEQV